MSKADSHADLSIDIHLPSGLVLRDAATMAEAKFRQWPWAMYDGIPVADPDTITDMDVDISFSGMNARNNVKRDRYKEGVRAVQQAASHHLRQIPIDAVLEAGDESLERLRQPLIGLFDCLTAVRGMKLANATKAVHRHRPHLIPVLDSWVRDYYWYAASLHHEELFRSFGAMNWGEYAFALLQLIRADVVAVREKIDAVRQSAANQDYGAVSRARLLESLIWYYYAGR
jgi:hypothetical protein